MSSLRDFVFAWLDPIGIVVSLLIAVPVAAAAWSRVFGNRRRRRQWLRQARADAGSRPGVLVVDLLPGRNIEAALTRHLQSDASLAAVPEDRRFTIARSEVLRPDDMSELVAQLDATAADIFDAGVDTLHLFHAGPAAVAAIIGAAFANGPRVLVYQFMPGSDSTMPSYACFGPILHA